MEHCVQVANEYLETKAFRNYTSDLLKAIAEHYGVIVNCRYSEIVDPQEKDTRTGDEIALEVIKKAGLKVKEDDTI